VIPAAEVVRISGSVAGQRSQRSSRPPGGGGRRRGCL